jgi:hypothetical protein
MYCPEPMVCRLRLANWERWNGRNRCTFAIAMNQDSVSDTRRRIGCRVNSASALQPEPHRQLSPSSACFAEPGAAYEPILGCVRAGGDT